MEKIGFIGAYDKMNIMLYIAKILTSVGKKVLIIDSTVNQKGRYIVPAIKVTKTCITEFEGIDVAVGIFNINELENYTDKESESIGYDIMMVDIDSANSIEAFGIRDAKINYFVTAFDAYSLRRGLEILSDLSNTIKLKKVLFSKEATQEEEEYLNFLALGLKVEWEAERIYFPFESGDQTTIIENQILSRIKFKKLTTQFKESLMYMAEEIVGEKEASKIRKTFKQIEKEL